jgi:chemotaxis protein MotB
MAINKGQVPNFKESSPAEIDKQDEKNDLKQLEMLKEKIQSMINMDAKLSDLKGLINLEITPEGLRIQLIDDKNTPMFKSASSETEPQIRLILRALAPVINKLPNKISINGHTDAKPFPANKKRYSNWELSSDRANAARYELNQGGLTEEKILRVTGLSDSIPYNSGDSFDPKNRRISIIVMNKKATKQVIQEVGTKPTTGVTDLIPHVIDTTPQVIQEGGTKPATGVIDTTPPATKTSSDKALNTEIKH